ncbi:MAG: hypothetical protein AAFP69_12465, partial [Planctomycetota bacterium]
MLRRIAPILRGLAHSRFAAPKWRRVSWRLATLGVFALLLVLPLTLVRAVDPPPAESRGATQRPAAD